MNLAALEPLSSKLRHEAKNQVQIRVLVSVNLTVETTVCPYVIAYRRV